MRYWKFDPEILTRTYTFVKQPRYPARIPPKKWPDVKLIGKAMARGWAVPCRYFPAIRGRGGFFRPYIFPGITDTEYGYILALMRQEE
jgi:hypothetical protein